MMLPSGGANLRSYQEFRKQQLPTHMYDVFDQLHDFSMSLGNNVIEDVRPHRVVFCKSMNTRWFVDAKPTDGMIVIKIRKGWRDPIQTVQTDSITQEIKNMIKTAYEQVH